jgi:hypothetical protein
MIFQRERCKKEKQDEEWLRNSWVMDGRERGREEGKSEGEG